MILIGSRALNEYIPINRTCHDWDLLVSAEELVVLNNSYKNFLVKSTAHSHIYDVIGTIVEVSNPENLTYSDKILLRAPHGRSVMTPFGYSYIPNIQTLYDMKKATAEYIDEPKHKYDQKLIETNFAVDPVTGFFELRLKETKERVAASNKVLYDFFHKYHIPKYIVHDSLHEMIADLLDIKMPTYKRITTAETNISEELFNQLSNDQKISLMAEETLVLNLERWLIPQFVENGINHRLVDMFYNNNEAMPTYKILKHVCLTGLKGEAKYITDFSKENFFEIENVWRMYKKTIKRQGGFPDHFFNKLFELREKYKKGELVAIS